MSAILRRDIRASIVTFLERCHIPHMIMPFDDDLYKECVDEAARREYPMEGSQSLQTYLREGVGYASTTCRQVSRPTQIWGALFCACIFFVDDSITRFPSEITQIYKFNERFIRGQVHDNGVLEAFAELLRQVPDLFLPVASNLIISATLDFVTGNLLEHQIKDMQISASAQQYAAFQRTISAGPAAFSLMAIPREIPVKDYIQALPEMMLFFSNTNDILSFYKEELAGETTNQISILAARSQTSKLHALNELVETTVGAYKRAIEILDGNSVALAAFKNYASGLVYFHTLMERYRLTDLAL